jgi:dihydroxyacetone kinase
MKIINTATMIKIINEMSDIIIKNEIPFCELDSAAGDGDFGMSLAKGFKQLKADWNTLDTENIGAFLKSCGMIIMEYCGGASGPIWGSAFRGAAKVAGDKTEINLTDLAELMQAAVVGIQKTGERSFGRGAVVGDKTLIDALVPAADTLTKCAVNGEDLLVAMRKSADAAVKGAESTKYITAKMGRAGTVGERSLSYPDAGAYGVGVIFTGIVDMLTK